MTAKKKKPAVNSSQAGGVEWVGRVVRVETCRNWLSEREQDID